MHPKTLQLALRRLARSPRLALGAVLCIAVGTAATSAALTLVSATLLRPLPYPEADRLVRVWLEEPQGDSHIELSYPDVLDLSQALIDDGSGAGGGLDAFEAIARARLQFRTGEGARRVEGEAVTDGYFRLLGVEPLFGRTFTAEEHRPGGPRVMLLDYRTWGEHFGYDEAVVGRTVPTDEGELTVVGVMPASFTGTVEEDSGDLEFWVPIEEYLSPQRRESRSIGGIWSLGRLAPGISLASLRSELDALGRRLTEDHPEAYGARVFTVEPMGENWRSELRRGGLLLLAAAGLLLIVAAANVAVLLLARTLNGRREHAIRAALGADRGRLLGQTLLETVLLVAAGSALGLGVGPPLLRFFLDRPSLVDTSTLGIPAFVRLEIDPMAAGLSCLVFLVTALVAGLGPALLASRTDPAQVLQEAGRSTVGSRRTRRWTSFLILAEVALTTVLVVGAALLARSYEAMEAQDLGFRTDDLLRIALFVNEQEVPEAEALGPFYDRVQRNLVEEPGVERVGVVWPTVPMDWPIQQSLTVSGMEPPDPAHPEAGLRVGLFIADAAFFEVMDVPLLAGRGFRATDGPDAPAVALVSRSLARRIAEGLGHAEGARHGEDVGSVVGTEAMLPGLSSETLRIVGVVDDVRYGGPREGDTPAARHELYVAFRQSPTRLMSLIIATSREPESLVPPLSRRLGKLAPVSALDWIGPLDRWVTDLFLTDTRFLLSLVGAFSLAGLFLSAVGLFAVLADSVVRRRPEIGVRQALGATPARIVRTVVLQGLRLVALGLVAGSLLAWASDRAIESHLYGITATDPTSYLLAGAVLLATALAASLLPARNAARVDPAEILREE